MQSLNLLQLPRRISRHPAPSFPTMAASQRIDSRRSHRCSMIEGQGLAVIALGGNAILRPGEEATFSVQMRHLHATMRRVVSVMDRFSGMVFTHGNGPQVGDILLQNEMARAKVPPMPLDVCVAQSQGQIGYMVQLALMNELRRAGIDADVICAFDEYSRTPWRTPRLGYSSVAPPSGA